MAAERLSMRQIRDILRQKWALGLSHRAGAQMFLNTVRPARLLPRGACPPRWPRRGTPAVTCKDYVTAVTTVPVLIIDDLGMRKFPQTAAVAALLDRLLHHAHLVTGEFRSRRPQLHSERNGSWPLGLLQPVIPGHQGVVLVSLAVALPPIKELPAVDPQPAHHPRHRHLRPAAELPDEIHDRIPGIRRHPGAGQGSPSVFFSFTYSSETSAMIASLRASFASSAAILASSSCSRLGAR